MTQFYPKPTSVAATKKGSQFAGQRENRGSADKKRIKQKNANRPGGFSTRCGVVNEKWKEDKRSRSRLSSAFFANGCSCVRIAALSGRWANFAHTGQLPHNVRNRPRRDFLTARVS